jgi:hypothetical protein
MRQLHNAEVKRIKNKQNENTEGRKWAKDNTTGINKSVMVMNSYLKSACHRLFSRVIHG